MTTDEVPLWRKCELAWAAYLRASGQLVNLLADANGNGAPLLFGDTEYRAPDILAVRGGRSVYWEVKQRHSASVNLVTGDAEYWVSYDSFIDYYHLARVSGIPVEIILHDGEVWNENRKWLQADVATIFTNGERGTRRDSDGSEIEAWIWPASAMRLVDGPEVELAAEAGGSVLVREGGRPPVPDDLLAIVEEELRRGGVGIEGSERGDRLREIPPGVFDLLREDAKASLATLARGLGLPETPRYSVLRIGLHGVDIDDVLGLMDYGIRVFLVFEVEPTWPSDDGRTGWLEACKESRLLEWTVVEGANEVGRWIVDGDFGGDDAVGGIVAQARPNDPFNPGQYLVVHRGYLDHVLVTAGAGTGKTETMSERIVFLLATAPRHPDPRDDERIFRLHLDEIVLVTFTRDAAREMRERIARTLMLRQRLCSRCVLPTIAWMLELSNTEIETIHTYSKKLISREGARIGIGPGFEVGNQTLEFARALGDALSPHLEALYAAETRDELPPAHEFQAFAATLWEKLAGNGFSPLGSALGVSRDPVSWGSGGEGLHGDVARSFEAAVAATAKAFAEVCIANQKVPVTELVATAARAIDVATGNLARTPRYLFVDEFQDTDSEQIGMLLAVRRLSGATLFVVGDEKQGIYRFRGAEGNAFRELAARAAGDGVSIVESTLNLNFRSGSSLLDSLHPLFDAWGKADHLRYGAGSKLVAARGTGSSRPISVTALPWGKERLASHVLGVVRRWLQAHEGSGETIAVLCRANWQARNFAEVLKAAGISCETRVGGDFFRTPVVSDLRVFLEAVLDPEDDGALLELCSTRWFPGIAAMQRPAGLDEVQVVAWGESLPPMIAWAERLSTLQAGGSFERSDLDALRARIEWLRRSLDRSSVLGWLMDCDRWFDPRSAVLPSDLPGDGVENVRYGRGFDHLVTLLDENFSDAPISSHGLLEWLRLKVATDVSTDEPDPAPGSTARVTVVTVHKSKGLEYDRVVIPHTDDKFEKASGRTESAVVADEGGPRLIWRWLPAGRVEFTNVGAAEHRLWEVERDEKVREEARLLYVAMTRAREELEVVVSGRIASAPVPNSWAQLLGVAS